ncbi:MAG: type II toxin-antitoxin system VapB family antitoxin [Sphingomonadales bacterium]|nr:MAG: type II toxin-antitoxin system VapB family antitoxin [Sphingomonadales bacterium]
MAGKRVRFEREREAPDGSPLLSRAHELTGIEDRERLIEEALRVLVAREAGLRLADLGGTMPGYAAPRRERPE